MFRGNQAGLAGANRQRWLEWCLALGLFALSWAWLLGQNDRVFERQAVHSVERLVADTVPVPLPRLMKMRELAALCQGGLPAWTDYWPGATSERLGSCLADPKSLDPNRAPDLLKAWGADLQSRIDVARKWADAYDRSYAERRRVLEAQLRQTQGLPVAAAAPASAARPVALDPYSGDGILREPRQGEAGRLLRQHADATQAWLGRLLADTSRPATERAAEVGLLIAGKQVQRDFGASPPREYLNTDLLSLAERLEWQRRAQGYVNDGLSLAAIAGLSQGVMLASLVLLAAAAWLRMALLPWVGVSVLLGLGCLLLVDMGLSADAAFRTLAFRQWEGVPVPGTGWRLWWPLVVVALVLVLLRHPRIGRSAAAAWAGRQTDRWWVRWGFSARWGWLQMLLLLGLGLGALAVPGFAAAKSEVIIALGCLGLATFVAREAALGNAGGSFWPQAAFRRWLRRELALRRGELKADEVRPDRQRVAQVGATLAVVLGAMAAAIGGSIARGDLGHALVAVGMAGVFMWLVSGRGLRAALLCLAAPALALLAYIYVSHSLPGWLMSVVRAVLPYHAQERFIGMVDPLSVTASDMARVRWLMDSAGLTGWGAGWVPWGGLGDVRLADGVPLQGPSDYVPALLVAQWGAVPGALVMLAVLVLFVGAAVVAGRTALAQGVSPAARLLSALGLFGCVLMAFKVVLSLGGVTGVLPLTGLPVALVGYGPVSTLFGLLYLTLALGTRHHRLSTGVHLRKSAPLQGELARRGRALVGVSAVVLLVLTLGAVARMNAPLSKGHAATACAVGRQQAPEGPPDRLLDPARAAAAAEAAAARYAALRNAQPHCAASAYRMTQALVSSVEHLPQATAAPVAAAAASAAPAAASGAEGQTASDAAGDDTDGAEVDAGEGLLVAAGLADATGANAGRVFAANRSEVAVCPQMSAVVRAWNDRLAEMQTQGASHVKLLSAQSLWTQMQWQGVAWDSASLCRHRARELGLLLQSALPRSLEAGGRPVRGETARFASFFSPQASKAVTPADFETPNAWRGLPGCVVPVASLAAGRSERRCTVEDRASRRVPVVPAVAAAGTSAAAPVPAAAASGPAQASQPIETATLNNFWSQQVLGWRLSRAKSYTDEGLRFEWRGHGLQAGPVLGLTLEPKLQDLAQRVVECYTGQRRGPSECAGVLPANAAHAATYFGVQAPAQAPARMRAGAMGLVLAEVDSGRVVAFANSISDCSLNALATDQPESRSSEKRKVIGNINTAAKDAPWCAPWPDRTADYLALQAPALWLVPPGSSMKPLVVMSGVAHGLIKPSDRDRWRSILAQSHDWNAKTQNNIKEVAVSAVTTYRDVLREAGFDLQPPPAFRDRPRPHELLWGDPAGLGPAGTPRYGASLTQHTQLIGHRLTVNQALVDWRPPQNLPWPQFLSMWNDKQKKLPYAAQVQRYGQAALGEYPFAQAVANASIGGGDIRVSAMGLVEVWRGIDLRARQQDQKAALHLLEAPGTAVPRLPLKLATPAAAELAMYATGAVTKPGGTAHGACNRVFGDCRGGPGAGALNGKTGTSDFTQANTALVKPGLDLPAKLFGGVFEVGGKRYAVAAVGLRVRTGQLLDDSSAPAEAALTLQREMLRAAAPAQR